MAEFAKNEELLIEINELKLKVNKLEKELLKTKKEFNIQKVESNKMSEMIDNMTEMIKKNWSPDIYEHLLDMVITFLVYLFLLSILFFAKLQLKLLELIHLQLCNLIL